MATTKKAATAPAKPRVDYKIGTRVKVSRKNELSKGYTAPLHDDASSCVRKTPTGHFISVNVGTTKVPDVREFRPVAVRGY